MEFFRFKQKSKKIFTTCESCGAVRDSATVECKNCAQLSKHVPIADQKSSLDHDSALRKQAQLPAASSEAKSQTSPDSRQNIDSISDKINSPLAPPPVVNDLRSVITPAPFWKRFCAALIDYALVTIVALVCGLCVGVATLHCVIAGQHGFKGLSLYQSFGSSNNSSDHWPFSCLVPLIVMFGSTVGIWLPIAYFTLFESCSLKATPGKLLLGLMVISKNSPRIDFSPSFIKACIQEFLLFLIVVVATITVSIIELVFHARLFTIVLTYILELVLFASALCIPFLAFKTQSLLDLVVERFVIERKGFSNDNWTKYIGSNFSTTRQQNWQNIQKRTLSISYWIGVVLLGIVGLSISLFGALLASVTVDSLKQIVIFCTILVVYPCIYIAILVAWRKLLPIWKQAILYWSTAGVLIVALVSSMFIFLPYDYLLLQKWIKAVPIAEKGFKLDPTGKSQQSRRFFDQATKEFPEVWMPYFMGWRLARVFGLQDQAIELATKDGNLRSDDPTHGLLLLADLYADFGKRDKALSLCHQAILVLSDLDTTKLKDYKQKFSRLESAADLLLRLGNHREANELLTKLITIKLKSNDLQEQKASDLTQLFNLQTLEYLYKQRAESYRYLHQTDLEQKDLAAAAAVELAQDIKRDGPILRYLKKTKDLQKYLKPDGTVQLVYAAKHIPGGHKITRDELITKQVPLKNAPDYAFCDPKDVVGKVAQESGIFEGLPIYNLDVGIPKIIKPANDKPSTK
jgi:tetratricopeptide (TPR) repeat protein